LREIFISVFSGKIDSYHFGDFHQLIEKDSFGVLINPLNGQLNPIRHFLALLGAHHILHVSRIRVKFVSAGRQHCQYKSRTYHLLGHFVIL
jgi:hypothetical protein